MSSIHDDTLRSIAIYMSYGSSETIYCPECGKFGFSIKREPDRLLYHCFKAGCGFSGMVPLRGCASQEHTPSPAPQEERLTPYTDLLQPLSDKALQLLMGRFEISAHQISENVALSAPHYMLGIYAPDTTRRGWVKRIPWDGTEFYGDNTRGPKSQIFKEKHEPMISWYAPRAHSVVAAPPNAVILVEDQMSAIKLADCGYLSCALLGTSLNSEKVAEIQSVSKCVTIALDSDATATAFKLARKWQHAFVSCKVIILTSDPKDMTNEEIKTKFGA